ncbi:RnfABCDGE type electron transport complex subunit D [Chlamydiota bacterium]
MENSKMLTVSEAPHIRDKSSISSIMWNVNLSLVPALIAGVYFFGLRSLSVVLISVLSAVISEAAYQFFTKKKITVNDGSAVVTGILIAFCLPPGLPLWMAAIGSAFGIIVAKHLFGGLGHNIFNPALVGRAVLLASFPVQMTTWTLPLKGVTGATPLAIVKLKLGQTLPGYFDLFIGKVGGCIGETSVLLLLIGAGFLFYKKIITWYIPVSFLVSMIMFSKLFGRDPIFEIMAGGAILGAFFMATDMVTTPQRPSGEMIFGAGAGLITVIIRKWGGYPEGVCYSILLMNAVTPIIDRYQRRG